MITSLLGTFFKSVIMVLAVAFTVGALVIGGTMLFIHLSPDLTLDLILANLAFLEMAQ